MKDYNGEIAYHEAIIKSLRDEQKRFINSSPEAKLAVALHDIQCHWNHTDQCGWFYEFENNEPDWDRDAHATYLDKARKVISAMPDADFDDVIAFMKVLKEIK